MIYKRYTEKGAAWTCKRIYLLAMLMVIMFVLQNVNNNVEGKTLHGTKKTLKRLQVASSLIQTRHKRDTYGNAPDNNDYYDDNYDALPDSFATGQPPTFGDHISAQANKIAESFSNMWQSLTESIHHCFEGLRAIFNEAVEDGELTPEEEEELFLNMKENYRQRNEYENEVIMKI